jgi:hypothetical protein
VDVCEPSNGALGKVLFGIVSEAMAGFVEVGEPGGAEEGLFGVRVDVGRAGIEGPGAQEEVAFIADIASPSEFVFAAAGTEVREDFQVAVTGFFAGFTQGGLFGGFSLIDVAFGKANFVNNAAVAEDVAFEDEDAIAVIEDDAAGSFVVDCLHF